MASRPKLSCSPGHQPGDGGLAGAGVAGEDHVHRKAGRLEAGGRPALLHLNVVGQTKDVLFDLVQTHQGVQLPADCLDPAVPGGGQQVGQGSGGAAVDRKAERAFPDGEGGRPRLKAVLPQAVFAQGAEDPLTAAGQRSRALLVGMPGGHIVPHVLPGREGQLKLPGAAAGQLVQQPGGQSLQALAGEGLCLAGVPEGGRKVRPQQAGHLGPALMGEKDQVLAPWSDPADRARRQSGAGVDQDPLPVDQIAGSQRRGPLDGQVGQGLEEGGAAALIVVEEDHLSRAVQGGVEVLQKELFGPGVGVEGQVHSGRLVALQKAAGRHPAGGLL